VTLPLFGEESTAEISPCGLYRYTLRRVWDRGKPLLVCCLLNPSTADAKIDDRTVKLLVQWARMLGYGGLLLVNLFAFRSTDPGALKTAADPVGALNDSRILESVQLAGGHMLCAWGVGGALRGRAQHVTAMLRAVGVELYQIPCERHDGPCHPLHHSVRGQLERVL